MSDYDSEIEELLTDDSFIRWIEGNATDKESQLWENWINNDPARKQLVEEATFVHRQFSFRNADYPEMESELVQLEQTVSTYESSKEENNPQWRIAKKWSRAIPRAAAAILLLVTTVIAYQIAQSYEFQPVDQEAEPPALVTTATHNGQKKVLTLSDGSRITLNANSKLEYPTHYSGGDLEVWLQGEAYFNVVHKTGVATRFFTVHTPDGEVQVLGTKFNVNTYKELTEVVLEEGRVSVEVRDSLAHLADTYVMKPGEKSRFSKEKAEIVTSEVEPDLYTSWILDKLTFDHTPLVEVARRIEHIYGVQFEIADSDVAKVLVSGSIPNNNLEVFLNGLEKMVNRPVTNKDGAIYVGETELK